MLSVEEISSEDVLQEMFKPGKGDVNKPGRE